MLDPERTHIDKRSKPACPICSKPVVKQFAPFCSDRCRQVDLNRWLGESYRIETDESPDGLNTGSYEDNDGR